MAKNFDNLTMIFIFDKTLLRLDIYILSTRYLKNRAPCFFKVTEHNNICFDYKIIEDENGKEDGKEMVTNLEEEASKNRHNIK